MGRATLKESRVVEEEIDILQCDVCEARISDPPKPDSEGYSRQPLHRENTGRFMICNASHQMELKRSMDLCEACAGVTWDWLQERKKK